jgi:hypothetical protein
VVTYEKNVTYALAGVQDSDATLASHACGSGLRAVIYGEERHLCVWPSFETPMR